jgi:hypothetical protein
LRLIEKERGSTASMTLSWRTIGDAMLPNIGGKEIDTRRDALILVNISREIKERP